MGAELSRYLEQDAFLSANGVIRDDDPATRDGSRQNVRRTPANVAQRAQLFEFCKDWDIWHVKEFLRWYSHFACQEGASATDSLADVISGVDQADLLAQDITAMEVLLDQLEKERAECLERQDLKRSQNDPDDRCTSSALGDIDKRKHEIQLQLREKQQRLSELDLHFLASMDGVDFRQTVKWPIFMNAMTQLNLRGEFGLNHHSEAEWHPVCLGFKMQHESEATTQLTEFIKGDIELPPLEAHEIDGHTDDSASSSAASADEEDEDGEHGDDEQPQSGNADGTADIERNTSENSAAAKTQDNDSDNDSSEEDEIVPQTTQSTQVLTTNALATNSKSQSTTTSVADASQTEGKEPSELVVSSEVGDRNDIAASAELLVFKKSLKDSRIVKRSTPDMFNPECRHPVFFGYSLEKQGPIVDERIKAQHELDDRENNIFAVKIENLRKTMEAITKSEQGKQDALDQRERELAAKRSKHWEKREADLNRAKKELDPNDMYFRMQEAQDKRAREQETLEDTEIQRLRQSAEERIKMASETYRSSMAQIQEVRVTDRPLGELRIRFHEKEMERLQLEVNETKRVLASSKDEYVALTASKIRIPGQDTKHRAQQLFAEGQIKSKEAELEQMCKLTEDEQFLFQRARAMFEREQMFVPLFRCLMDDTGHDSEQVSRSFVLLDLAAILLLGVGSSFLDSRTQFIFDMFAQTSRHPRYHSDDSNSKLLVLSPDAFAEILNLLVLSMIRLGDLHLPHRLSPSVFRGIAEREFLNLNTSVLQSGASTDSLGHGQSSPVVGMTYSEFHRFCIESVEKSKYLCQLLGHPWRHEGLSRYVIQNMSTAHQYKLGLINVNDMAFSIAQQLLRPRGDLSRWKRLAVHERALAMGENDPLKTDYSKYLPKRRTKLLSKVVPLDHGGYRNLVHYRMQVILRSAIKLQTTWRAKKGRQIARLAAEKQAFYHARGLALSRARQDVESDWAGRDAKPAHSVEKMKFEAKIRMKQVKLRTKGNAFSREQVLALMIEEAVQVAQKEVENRYREMEEELGYVSHQQALAIPHAELGYLDKEISKGLVTQLANAKQESPVVAPLLETIAMNEERDRKKIEMKKRKSKGLKNESDRVMDEVPETNIAEEAALHFTDDTGKVTRQRHAQIRKENMLFGRFPSELYQHGLSKSEEVLRMVLSVPDPSLQSLQERLKTVCYGMTTFKMTELMEELPSKRHICMYVTGFRRVDGIYDMEALERDLFEHFRIVRGSTELAEALVNIAESDLEFGLSRVLLDSLQCDLQCALSAMVAAENGAIARANASIMAKKLVRMGFKSNDISLAVNGKPPADPDDSSVGNQEPDNPSGLLLLNEQRTLEERRKQVRDAQARLVEAMNAWRDAELSLHETERRQLRVSQSYPVLSAHRSKWSERFQCALRLPDESPTQVQTKYTELFQVCQDFIETATSIALTLVREIHLPAQQKSILPIGQSAIDGRSDDVRCVTRLKYEVHNILFKLCTDDHGRFEGSDELAAKYGGHEIRSSALYLRKLGMSENVLIPLQCVVDYQGYRVLCASKVPVEIIKWNESGSSIQKRSKQLVHGTDNRGKSIVLQNKEMNNVLSAASVHLNLSKHAVRGYQDLTSKVIHAPGDLQGYLNEKKQMILVNFARAMPPEDPESTPHLLQSTRGMSILWRQLRPELVTRYHMPLSPDALSCFTYGTPDWQAQALGVEEATDHLVRDVITSFARKLSRRSGYFDAPHFSLPQEMHRHGINIRHMGLLRSCFFFRLSGTATLQYSMAEIQTTEDFTREVDRGSPIFIDGRSCTISTNTAHRYDPACVTLSITHSEDSKQNVAVYSGRTDCKERSDHIRAVLLAEMVARTFKNILRHLLRLSAKLSASGLTPYLLKQVVIHSLNLLTGSRDGSEAFYNTHLYEGIRSRFGPLSISEVDKQNLRKQMLRQMHYIVGRSMAMMGYELTPVCMERLKSCPDCYTFVLDDFATSAANPYRVKHSMVILDFSLASLLLLQATVKQATTYRRLVLADAPHGYWSLCERRGTLTASNLGTYGGRLTGTFTPGCQLEGDGPILNADINRALQLRKEARSFVKYPFVQECYPETPESHISLEVWCRCDGHESTRRVVLTIGRFSLSALKGNMWAFSTNVRNIDILAFGSQVELQKWTHLVGTYDGTILRLYVDGFLQNEVDVETVVDQELQKREAIMQRTRDDIDDLESEAKGKCYKDVDREMQSFFASKEGRRQIKEQSQQYLDQHEFRVRLSKAATATGDSTTDSDANKDGDEGLRSLNASGATKKQGASSSVLPTKKDLSKTYRSDFEPLVKKQLLREKFDATWAVLAAEFQEMRHHINLKIHKELEEQSNQNCRQLRIGCLSTASRRDGKYFFHGSIAHVAYYNGVALTRDQINAHYVMGTRDRAQESDHLFALASSRFSRALTAVPDDKQMLEKFAENICASLKYDLDHQHAKEMYKKKVRCGMQPLLLSENVHGIAEILKNLPRDPAFSELFIYCYKCILKLEPDYFKPVESTQCRLALKELGRLPFAFFLGSHSANALVNIMNDHDHAEDESIVIEVFADVVRKLLDVFPTFYGDQLTDMNWLNKLANRKAIVYFVLAIEAGEDSRTINLQDVTDISDDDMLIIARNNRFCSAFHLAHCVNLSNATLKNLAMNCDQIEELNVSHCNLVTDEGLIAVSKTCHRLVRLWISSCHQVRDVGIEAVVRANPRLEHIDISFCEHASDRSLASFAKFCPVLAVVEAELCVQIGNSGLKCLALSHQNPTSLWKLNVGGCHRIGDEGMVEVAKRCTRLREINVRRCDKLTDISMRAITHNCLELEVLNMEEVFAPTFKLFLFDHEGDGRGVVDKHMLRKLRDVNLSGCNGLNDLAIGHLANRSKELESLSISGCEEITDCGLGWVWRDMLDGSVAGSALTCIDLSYCPQLTANAIHQAVVRCPKLVSLNLSGCTNLSEDQMIEIIVSCSRINRLAVAYCREVSDKVLRTMTVHMSLEELNVARCSRITDDGMLEIAAQFTGLRKVNVSACKKLTERTLNALYENASTLQELDATHCPYFSPQALARFVRRKVNVTTRSIEAVHVKALADFDEHAALRSHQFAAVGDGNTIADVPNDQEIDQRRRRSLGNGSKNSNNGSRSSNGHLPLLTQQRSFTATNS